MTTTEMQVHMDCAGCESKIRKALRKIKGVDQVDIDMGMQKVTVTGWADQKKVLKVVRKTGRRAEIWQFQQNPEEYYQEHLYGGGPVTHHAPQPPSSYNYYKHGYDYSHGYYHPPPAHSTILGYQTAAAFSDENPHGCSIM